VSEKQSGAIPCCRRALAAPEAHKSNPASPRRLGAVHYASATLIRPPSRSISRKCHQLSLAIVSRTAPGHLLTANDSNSRRFSTLIQPKNRTALSEGRRRQGDRSLTILKHAVRIYARWFLLSASLSLSSVFGLQSPCVFHQLLDDLHRDAAGRVDLNPHALLHAHERGYAVEGLGARAEADFSTQGLFIR